MEALLVVVGLSWAAIRGAEHVLKVDPAKLGPTQATLVIEAPNVVQQEKAPKTWKDHGWKWDVTVTLATYAECPTDPKKTPKLAELGDGTVGADHPTQTATIPGDMDLALFAQSEQRGGASFITCEDALRFHSEAGKTYRLHMTPHTNRDWSHCSITFVEVKDGQDVPVPSAHKATLVKWGKGITEGSATNICVNSAEGDATLVPKQ